MRSANESRRRILIDTNVLIALINGAHPAHESVEAQLAELQAEGHALIVAPQCVYEFWVVATRPVVNNGLGKSPAEADELLEQILNTFQQYDDPLALLTNGGGCASRIRLSASAPTTPASSPICGGTGLQSC